MATSPSTTAPSRRRVQAALRRAQKDGTEITVASIAGPPESSGSSSTRRPDLLAAIQASHGPTLSDDDTLDRKRSVNFSPNLETLTTEAAAAQDIPFGQYVRIAVTEKLARELGVSPEDLDGAKASTRDGTTRTGSSRKDRTDGRDTTDVSWLSGTQAPSGRDERLERPRTTASSDAAAARSGLEHRARDRGHSEFCHAVLRRASTGGPTGCTRDSRVTALAARRRRDHGPDYPHSELAAVIESGWTRTNGPPAASLCAEVKDGRWFDEEDEITDDNGLRLATINSPPVTTHIARNDPARVLRRVKATRSLVAAILEERHDWHKHGPGFPCCCGRDANVARLLGIIASEWEKQQ